MKQPGEWREKLGLTQQEMAEYLGVTRSQWAMYEKGLRFLPLPGIAKLAKIANFIEKPSAIKKNYTSHISGQQDKATKLLEDFAREQDYQRKKLQRELAKREKAYEQNILLLEFLDHLRSAAMADPVTTIEESDILKVAEAKAVKSLEKNGLHQQALLKAKIAGIPEREIILVNQL